MLLHISVVHSFLLPNSIPLYGYNTICVSGGVGANGYLRECLQQAVKGKNIKLVIPEKRYCTDNGAMIGAEGFLQYKLRNFANLDLNAQAVVPLDTYGIK